MINDKETDDSNSIIIDRSTIPELLHDPDFVEAANVWVDYKAFGSPYGGGYLEWPCQYYDVVKLYDGLYARYKVND